MSRHISPEAFYNLPSGDKVHPCRLIHKDGTLMWKHALLSSNVFQSLPLEIAHEAHIIKTAQRIEELNSWVSQGLDPWECLRPINWYMPTLDGFEEGITVEFVHTSIPANSIFDKLLEHKQEHEALTYDGNLFKFVRC
jgi:hypothetical protein